MTINDVSRIVRRGWRIIVVCVVVGLAVAAAGTALTPREFSASATLFVTTQSSGENTNALYQGNLVSQQRTKSYVELAQSPRVAQEVARQVGLSEPVERTTSRLSAEAPLDTVLISVTGTGATADQAVAIANSASSSLTRLVDELERPVDPGSPPATAVRVVEPASLPDGPVSPRLSVNLALGFLAGALLGSLIAAVRALRDNKIDGVDQLRTLTSAPHLGSVSFDSNSSGDSWNLQDMSRLRAEQLRRLRTNLQFVDFNGSRRVLLVTSALPGEGKSTVITGLAATLVASGSRVVLLDGDLRRPRLASLLGLESAVGLSTVLSGRVVAARAIQSLRSSGVPIDVMTAGQVPPNPSELLSSEKMEEVLSELSNKYDYVLVDTPPLLPVTDAAALAPLVDGVMFVCQADSTNSVQVSGAIEALTAVNAKIVGTVLNKVKEHSGRDEERYGYGSYYGMPEAPSVPATSSSVTAPARGLGASEAVVGRPSPHRRG